MQFHSLTGIVSEGDCDLPRSYRFCLKLRLGHVSCDKRLCRDEIGCISGDQSSLRMQEMPFQRPCIFKISLRAMPPDPPRSSRPSASTRFVALISIVHSLFFEFVVFLFRLYPKFSYFICLLFFLFCFFFLFFLL